MFIPTGAKEAEVNRTISQLMTLICFTQTVGCGGAITVEEPVVEIVEDERWFCDYDINGACVRVEDRFMDVDPAELSWMLGRLEYEVNFFYPGLDFNALAEQEFLKIDYRWVNRSTEYAGLYYNSTTTARINLRSGDTITPLMKCVDRYYIAAHEVLHFIVARHLFFDTSILEDVHIVPYIFNRWARSEDMPHDYTVEGRLYTMIWRRCYDSIQE